MPSWTAEEQEILIEIIREHPKAARDSTQLELAFVKAIKKLPRKTEGDLIQCFKHIQHRRVAYFGGICANDVDSSIKKCLRRPSSA